LTKSSPEWLHEAMAGKDMYSKLWNVVCSFTRSSSCRKRLFNKQASWNASSHRNTTYTLKNPKKLKQNNQTKRGRLCLAKLRIWIRKKARLQQDISSLEASADTLLT